MNGSFLNLNPEEVEKNVTSWYKGLFKVSRLLSQKEATACAADCDEIRKQVNCGLCFCNYTIYLGVCFHLAEEMFYLKFDT